MDNDILSLIAAAQSGDKKAESIAVEQNMGLVWSCLKRFYNRGADMDDLFQIGCMGLLKAVKNFDTSYNVKFSTYAVPLIMGEIKRFLRDDGLIKVSRSLKETAQRANVAREQFRRDQGREPALSELAAKLEISTEDLTMAMDATAPAESLYQTYGSDEGKPMLLLDKVCAEGSCEDEVINSVALREALSTFQEREQEIIRLRYFKNKTQSEVAARLGISQVQVSRLEKKILLALREKIG